MNTENTYIFEKIYLFFSILCNFMKKMYESGTLLFIYYITQFIEHLL